MSEYVRPGLRRCAADAAMAEGGVTWRYVQRDGREKQLGPRRECPTVDIRCGKSAANVGPERRNVV